MASWLALLLCPIVVAAQAAATGQPPADWRLELSEEFGTPGDSSQLARRWQFTYPWGRTLGGSESEYYVGAEVNVRGGELLLTARRLPQPLAHTHGSEHLQLRYTSGMLYARHPTRDSLRPAGCPPGEGLSYGWYELRCRQPRDFGSFPAFWLYGPPDELDIVEADPAGISNNIHLNEHEYWRQGPVEQADCQCFYAWPGAGTLATSYHRYALEWLPNQLTFYFDGVPIRRETRFLPLGCQQTLIANLAVWAWSHARADTLAIDYIRVYRPRQLPPVPFGSPDGSRARPAFLDFPRLQAPERSHPAGQQTWALVQPAGGGLYLALRDNLNPACASRLHLPLAADWRSPWQAGWGATPLVVQVPAGPLLRWALLDAQGQLLQQGECPAGQPWAPPVADLLPGTYQLRLRRDAAVGYQPLFVLGRPPDAHPTAEWLRPLPPPEL